MTQQTAVGREAYLYFLKNVALYPYSPEQLLAIGRQEWERSVAFEEMERHRNREIRELKMFASLDDQIKRTGGMEAEIRHFLVEQEILSVPDDFPHYTIRPIPAYVADLGGFAEFDDFTGPVRLDQNCVRWAPPPSDTLGYFAKANARDPRPDILHEGVPGHYMQLWLGWRNEDTIRRHYYDSGANEGLAFYVSARSQRCRVLAKICFNGSLSCMSISPPGMGEVLRVIPRSRKHTCLCPLSPAGRPNPVHCFRAPTNA